MVAECPACKRRLTLRNGVTGTFKSSCSWDGCGAELLCSANDIGELVVLGPRALHEEEQRLELAVRANDADRGFTADGTVVVVFVVIIGSAPLLVATMVGGGKGFLAGLLGCFLLFVIMLAAIWVKKRLFDDRAPPPERLVAHEGALERWEGPEGYRG
jgi:hypothetical protein